jgi:hypothetical protein
MVRFRRGFRHAVDWVGLSFFDATVCLAVTAPFIVDAVKGV